MSDPQASPEQSPYLSPNSGDRSSYWDDEVPDIGNDPIPTILKRNDHTDITPRAFFYREHVIIMFGPSDSGKTYTALQGCKEVLDRDGTVAYFDFERNKKKIARKLRHLGVIYEEVWGKTFLYKRPSHRITTEEFEAIEEKVATAELAVIDGYNAVLSLYGYAQNSGEDIGQFMIDLPNKLMDLGCAVLIIDHPNRSDTENENARFSAGSNQKFGLADCVYRVHPVTKFAEGQSGSSKLICFKDQAGGKVGGYNHGNKHVADIYFRADISGALKVEIGPPILPTEQAFYPDKIMEKVSRLLEQEEYENGLAVNAIKKLVKGKNDYITDAINILESEGYIRKDISATTHLCFSVKAFRRNPMERSPGNWDTYGDHQGNGRGPLGDSDAQAKMAINEGEKNGD